MFCDKCGNQLRDGAKFCHKCGASVSELEKYQNNANQSQAQPAQQAQTVNQTPKQQVVYQPVYQPQPRPYYAPGTHPYHRLGGFLMFTVVISYISGVSSFINVLSTIISYSGLLKSIGNWLPGGFKTWIVLNMIVFSILQLSAGIISISFANRIRRKESNFLRFIQSSSLTLCIIMIIWFLISFIWIKQYDQYGVVSWGSLIGILIAMVIGLIIGVILGSVYYGCSVRVRTYMGSDSYLKQSIFNKNSHPIPVDGSDQPQYNYQSSDNMNSREHQWRCDGCGNMISSDPCPHCGKRYDTAWTCSKCGEINSSVISSCVSCGTSRFPKSQKANNSDWSCPNCLRVNASYVTTCLCGTPKSQGVKLAPANQRIVGENEWLCPACGKVNANYVGTCGCGQVKP